MLVNICYVLNNLWFSLDTDSLNSGEAKPRDWKQVSVFKTYALKDISLGYAYNDV